MEIKREHSLIGKEIYSAGIGVQRKPDNLGKLKLINQMVDLPIKTRQIQLRALLVFFTLIKRSRF